jgi:hypothetical protein
MPKQRNTRPTVFERAAEYEQQNPRLAETLKRYAVVMQTYQSALYALTGPQISISNSTVRLDQPRIW